MSAHRSDAPVSTPLDRVAGSAAPALFLTVLLGVVLLLIAGATGKLSHLVEHLPLGHQPNGFTLFILLDMVAFCCWRVHVRRREVAAYELELRTADDKWPGL